MQSAFFRKLWHFGFVVCGILAGQLNAQETAEPSAISTEAVPLQTQRPTEPAEIPPAPAAQAPSSETSSPETRPIPLPQGLGKLSVRVTATQSEQLLNYLRLSVYRTGSPHSPLASVTGKDLDVVLSPGKYEVSLNYLGSAQTTELEIRDQQQTNFNFDLKSTGLTLRYVVAGTDRPISTELADLLQGSIGIRVNLIESLSTQDQAQSTAQPTISRDITIDGPERQIDLPPGKYSITELSIQNSQQLRIPRAENFPLPDVVEIGLGERVVMEWPISFGVLEPSAHLPGEKSTDFTEGRTMDFRSGNWLLTRLDPPLDNDSLHPAQNRFAFLDRNRIAVNPGRYRLEFMHGSEAIASHEVSIVAGEILRPQVEVELARLRVSLSLDDKMTNEAKAAWQALLAAVLEPTIQLGSNERSTLRSEFSINARNEMTADWLVPPGNYQFSIYFGQVVDSTQIELSKGEIRELNLTPKPACLIQPQALIKGGNESISELVEWTLEFSESGLQIDPVHLRDTNGRRAQWAVAPGRYRLVAKLNGAVVSQEIVAIDGAIMAPRLEFEVGKIDLRVLAPDLPQNPGQRPIEVLIRKRERDGEYRDHPVLRDSISQGQLLEQIMLVPGDYQITARHTDSQLITPSKTVEVTLRKDERIAVNLEIGLGVIAPILVADNLSKDAAIRWLLRDNQGRNFDLRTDIPADPKRPGPMEVGAGDYVLVAQVRLGSLPELVFSTPVSIPLGGAIHPELRMESAYLNLSNSSTDFFTASDSTSINFWLVPNENGNVLGVPLDEVIDLSTNNVITGLDQNPSVKQHSMRAGQVAVTPGKYLLIVDIGRRLAIAREIEFHRDEAVEIDLTSKFGFLKLEDTVPSNSKLRVFSGEVNILGQRQQIRGLTQDEPLLLPVGNYLVRSIDGDFPASVPVVIAAGEVTHLKWNQSRQRITLRARFTPGGDMAPIGLTHWRFESLDHPQDEEVWVQQLQPQHVQELPLGRWHVTVRLWPVEVSQEVTLTSDSPQELEFDLNSGVLVLNALAHQELNYSVRSADPNSTEEELEPMSNIANLDQPTVPQYILRAGKYLVEIEGHQPVEVEILAGQRLELSTLPPVLAN